MKNGNEKQYYKTFWLETIISPELATNLQGKNNQINLHKN